MTPLQKETNTVAFVLVSMLVIAVALSAGWKGPKMRPTTDRTFEPTLARLERGKYLAEGPAHCFFCHSELDWKTPGAPAVPGKKGAGRRQGPWIVAPNITPDFETGAGLWSDDALARAIREGISHDGRALYSDPLR